MFSNYKYNPDDPTTPDRVQKEIPEFQFKFKEKNKLILYTIYCYDPHSDLLKLFPSDFNRRKREAALKAGFKLKGGVFDEEVEDCIVGENEQYNDAICAFVVSFNIADLPNYVLHREIFFSEFKAAMSATDSKAKKEIMANVETASKQMLELEKKLFTDLETIGVRNSLYKLAEKQKLNLRPEDMAKLIADKELQGVLPDPHKLFSE